jgi:molybdopterin-containing oxidoreductase family membrane subunit
LEACVPDLDYATINEDALSPMSPPGPLYYAVLLMLAGGIGLLALPWIYQIHTGMGVAGISHPVGWGVYIANFVFWVGIAHSGTLISAILFLVRAKWRDSVSRAAEAMTIFAIMTAGLFPMVHLGRLWVVAFILPYPSQRQIWPNFTSPLVWDVLAVSTYFTVSLIFFTIGLIPDLAAARDRAEVRLGYHSVKARVYRALSGGWSGAGSQWRHYSRSYLYFAALATPLVISVHSVVSWDFAMANLPGWHTTLFAPYFVAGAIHSGLAMVLVLMIPMRRLLKLERLVLPEHLDAVARTILVTTAIMGYSYLVEPFTSWYSGDKFEWQFTIWRATGWPSIMFWSLFPLNVLIPATLGFKKVRQSRPALFLIGLCVVAGMWIERVMLITASTAHDFMPHNWGHYFPTWVEILITLGSFGFFLFLFFLFSRTLPTIPLSDLKGQLAEEELCEAPHCPCPEPEFVVGEEGTAVTAVFSDAGTLVQAVSALCQAGFQRMETFTPVKIDRIQQIMGQERSPVRRWALTGAVIGCISGFGLAIGASGVNGLIVGGKNPLSIIPYCIPAFEGTVLLGSIANLAAVIVHSRLFGTTPMPRYRRSFSNDKFGVVVAGDAREVGRARALLASFSPEVLDVAP